MMTVSSTKTIFTNSMKLGFLLIAVVMIINIGAGLTSSIYSTGDSAYIAIRTLNFSTAPYILFALLGFVLFNSSRRSDFIVRTFNVGAVLLAIGWLVVAMVAATSAGLVSEMLETLYHQNLILSALIAGIFSVVIISSAWMNRKSHTVER